MGNKDMIKELSEMLLSEHWDNNACLGYVLMALEDLEFSNADIERIIDSTRATFSSISVEEAAAYYCKSNY